MNTTTGDFGFASQKSLFNTTLGTYPYMAPEFFKDPSYDKQVDIWAIGNSSLSYLHFLNLSLEFSLPNAFTDLRERYIRIP